MRRVYGGIGYTHPLTICSGLRGEKKRAIPQRDSPLALSLHVAYCVALQRRLEYPARPAQPRAIRQYQGGGLSEVLGVDRHCYWVDSLCRNLERCFHRCVEYFADGLSVLTIKLAV